MKRSLSLPFYFIMTGILLLSCNETVEQEISTNATEELESSNTIDQKLISKSDTVLSVIGTIHVSPEAIAHVHSPVNGIIKRMYVHEGDKIQQGQKLLIIEHQDIIKLQEDYLKSYADLQLFQKDFERKESLYEKSAISEKEYLESKNKFVTSKAQFESFKNQLNLLGLPVNEIEKGNLSSSLTLKAPISGYITHIAANTGTHTQQDLKLIEMVNDSDKHLKLNVFSNDIAQVKTGQTVRFNFGDDTELYEGTVSRIGKMVDPTDRSVEVFVDLKNTSEHLVVGTTVFANIIL